MIFSLLLTYFKQNMYKEYFIHFANLLFTRLQVRGCHWSNLKNMFKTAGEIIDERYLNKWKNLNAKHTHVKREQRLFLHTIYHLKDISQKWLQEITKKHCFTLNREVNYLTKFKRRYKAGVLKIDQLAVAYHRQKNLWDLICPLKLRETDKLNVNDIMTDLMKKRNKKRWHKE